MEFMFRAGDHRPLPPPPPPPRQYASPLPPAVYGFSKQGFTVMRKPFDLKLEAINCEIELMRLREEKLLAEVERQLFLKEDARRELMLAEREMAIRGAAQAAGYSLPKQCWAASFSTAAPPPWWMVQSFHEWHRMEQLKSSDRRGFGAVPLLPPPPPPLTTDDSKQQRQVPADKSEVIVLEKPDPELFREKRKAEAPLVTDVDDVQPSDVKKNPKAKDEWSCALCRVTATSERTFNQHLRGKKHQRKEAGLRAQKASKVSQAAPAPPVPRKRRKTSGLENDLKVGDSPQCEETGNKKFKFWCEMCKVAAHATEVMEAHLKGKKHKARLQEVAQSELEKKAQNAVDVDTGQKGQRSTARVDLRLGE